MSRNLSSFSLSDVLLRRNVVDNTTSLSGLHVDDTKLVNKTVIHPSIHPRNHSGVLSVNRNVKTNNTVVAKRVSKTTKPSHDPSDVKYNRFISLPLTPFKDYGNEPIQYFPWNDGLNYTDLCAKILHRITQNGTYYVVSDSFHGGVGHKYKSLVYSLTYAILNGRRFVLDTWDSFWNETNPCIRGLRYTGSLGIFRKCGNKSNRCYLRVNAKSPQPNENLVFCDYRPEVFTSSNLQIIRDLGLIRPNQGWEHYKRIIYRLLLNPSPYNIQLIQQKRNEFKNIHFHLSVQLRCAGPLSDKPEGVVFISPGRLTRVPRDIDRRLTVLRLKGKHPNIYLSSDSSKAQDYIKKNMTSVNIYTLGTTKGHSTGGNFYRNLRVSLLDLYTLCLADHFLGTYRSSYSLTASLLCRFRSVGIIMTTKSFMKKG